MNTERTGGVATVEPARQVVRAMNCDVTMVTFDPAGARALPRAARWVEAYERRLSRFLSDSELSRMNVAAGRPFRASPQLFRLVSLSLDLARRSGGLFDPTVLRPLECAGYDRSFELIRGTTPPRAVSPERQSWRDVELDSRNRTIIMPNDCGIDLGGIGKGWAVDRLVSMLGSPSMVNAGGDVYVRGEPDTSAWAIGVADPFAPEHDLALLKVHDRGVATSSTMKRSWRSGDAHLHHLIDPRTGAPSANDVVQVTAIAPTATLADFHAKVALLQGADDAIAYLDAQPGVEGLVVPAHGSVRMTAGLRNEMEPCASS